MVFWYIAPAIPAILNIIILGIMFIRQDAYNLDQSNDVGLGVALLCFSLTLTPAILLCAAAIIPVTFFPFEKENFFVAASIFTGISLLFSSIVLVRQIRDIRELKKRVRVYRQKRDEKHF